MHNNLIKLNFDKAHKTYDQNCVVQNKISADSLQLLLQYIAQVDAIADFACGTGESTLRLMDAISYNTAYAIDFSEKLLAIAKNKLPVEVNLILADFDTLIFKQSELGLVFCNMGLQWSRDLNHTLTRFNHYLKENGWLLFSMPIENNFPELKEQYKVPMLIPASIEAALQAANFEVVEKMQNNYIETFATPYEALQSIKNVGAQGVRINNHKGLSRIYLDNLFIDAESPTLTYKVGIYLARKQVT